VHIGFWWENLRERNYLEDLGVEGKMDNQEAGWGHGLDSSGSGQGQLVGSCECGNILGIS
jgi:hypothetical protein